MDVKRICKTCKKVEVEKGRSVCESCKKKKKRAASREYQKRAYVKPCDAVMIQKPRKINRYESPISDTEQENYDKRLAKRIGQRVNIDINSELGKRVSTGRA